MDDLNTKIAQLWEKVFPSGVWLFSPTEKYKDLTGEYVCSGSMWSRFPWSSGTPTKTIKSNGYMNLKTEWNKSGSVFSEKLVDVTDYNKIIIEYKTITTGTENYFGLTLSKSTGYDLIENVVLPDSGVAMTNKVTLNIANVSGSFYLAFSLSESGASFEMDVISIHMEC